MSNKLFNVLNRKMSESDFIHVFGSIYEHSDWVPKKIINNFESEINNFFLVFPKEMINKLENPITNKINIQKVS